MSCIYIYITFNEMLAALNAICSKHETHFEDISFDPPFVTKTSVGEAPTFVPYPSFFTPDQSLVVDN